MAKYSLKHLNLDDGEFQILGHMTGINGLVQTAIHMPTGTKVAVKKYDMESLGEDDFLAYEALIRQEVMLMKDVSHPNILPIFSSFVVGSEICLVTPRMCFGSVRDLLNIPELSNGIPEMAAAFILRDVLSALTHLHSKFLVHRSIRASHILVDASNGGAARISGFRYACSLYDPYGQRVQDRFDYPLFVARTNLNWMSPEILQQNLTGYNEKSDIYSLGVTACEMTNGLIPFSEMFGTLMLLEKVKGAAPKLLDASTVSQEDSEGGEEKIKITDVESLKDTAHQPGDSGVGGSMGSQTNLFRGQGTTFQALSKRAAIYRRRTLSSHFHDFVAHCSILEAQLRPSAKELSSHLFFKLLKKSASHLTLSSLLHGKQRTEKSKRCLPKLPVVACSTNYEVEWDFGEELKYT